MFKKYKTWFSSQALAAGRLVDPRAVYDHGSVSLITTRAQAGKKTLPQARDLRRLDPLAPMPEK
jgi:hypothetical protein